MQDCVASVATTHGREDVEAGPALSGTKGKRRGGRQSGGQQEGCVLSRGPNR
jgi:hypothetical protein